VVATSAQASLKAATEAIWHRVHETELRRVATIEAAIVSLLEDRLDEAERAAAEREAHKLAGSAGTFGFHRASDLARELELLLGDGTTDRSRALRAAVLVEQLYTELAAAAVPAQAGPPAADLHTRSEPMVLVVSADPALAAAIAAQARGRGLDAAVVNDTAAAPAARAAVAEGAATAAVVHLGDGHDLAAPLGLVNDLERSGVAVVALMHAAATADRVRVLRAGAALILDSRAGADEIADAVATLLDPARQSSQRVLVVDDDETLLAAVEQTLDRNGVAVETLGEPERFWEVLSQVQPHLVLLDIDMPLVSGLELCRLVRSDPRWRELPVVFLSASRDPDTIREVYAAGADDFVSKPVVAPELLARIGNRLERARLHRLLVETDPLTGLANRRRLERDLARLELLADRYDGSLSVAVIDLDRFKRVNDRHGHAAGDQVLRRLAGHLRESFRGEDLVARLGGEEFFVAMHGMPRPDAVRRLQEVLTAFHDNGVDIGGGLRLHVGASAGVAEHRRDGVGFTELYRAADAALLVAKATGRGRVLAAGIHGPAQSRHVDVAIVEDDEVLAELLRHTLEIVGYSCWVLTDGVAAISALTAAEDRLTASAILLDIDLPGRSGFEVLHALREAGVTTTSAVLVVTARSSEQEAVRAVAEGATDHVAKPFSVPLLVEKLRRFVERAQ
jgi:diguanylate cyclase (GGDEF)-like protein